MPERLAGLSMPSAVWRSTSFVSKASVMFRTDTGQPPHALTEAWPGWAFVRALISPASERPRPVGIRKAIAYPEDP